MIFQKKFLVSLVMGMGVFLGIAATDRAEDHGEMNKRTESYSPEKPSWQNLKIIPKNIDEDQMERIMHRYSQALGVTCSYCHPDTKANVFPRRVDFASDEKLEKRIARKMMRMTDKINKKYFNYRNLYDFNSLSKPVLACNTCHRGLQKPNNVSTFIP